jgi:hypothetical protein
MLASVRMAALDRSRPRVSLEFSRLAARTVARQILGRYLGSASIGETQPRSVGFCGRAQRPCPAGHQSWRYLRACPTIRVLGSKIKSGLHDAIALENQKSDTTLTDAQLVVVQPYSISADVNVGEETASAREDRHDHMLCKPTAFAARWNRRNACRRSVLSSRAANTGSTRSPSTVGARPA